MNLGFFGSVLSACAPPPVSATYKMFETGKAFWDQARAIADNPEDALRKAGEAATQYALSAGVGQQVHAYA